MADWNKIKAEYIAGGTSYRKLAEKYGVSKNVIQKRSQAGDWIELRRQVVDKSNTAVVEMEAERRIRQAERAEKIADVLLDKLARAVDELDIQLAETVTKTKVIEYQNAERPDKPTKETVVEKTEIGQIHTIIDRAGLKAVATALIDVRKALGLQTSLEDKEQRARIAALEAKAGLGDEDDDNTGVLMLPEADAPLIDKEESRE